MIIAGYHPGDLVQIHAVLVLQNGAGLYTSRDRITAIDAHLFAFQVFGALNSHFRIVDNGAMMESPDEENRQRREPFSISARADVGRERHLADVELFSSHHAAKGIDERFDLFEVEFERLRSNGPVLQGLIISLRSKYRFQFEFGDGGIPPIHSTASRIR